MCCIPPLVDQLRGGGLRELTHRARYRAARTLSGSDANAGHAIGHAIMLPAHCLEATPTPPPRLQCSEPPFRRVCNGVQCAAAHGRACWLLTAMVIGGGGGGFGSGGGCISGIGQKIYIFAG